MKHVDVATVQSQDTTPAPVTGTLAIAFLVVGLIALAASFFMGQGDGSKRFYFSYLHNYVFFMSITLGAFFFTFVQHLVSAGWSVVVRRFAEILMWNVLPMAVLFIPIVLGREQIFHWLEPGVIDHDPLLQKKQPYLSQGFFFVRCAIYFVLWGGLAAFFFGRSVKQDETKDFRPTMTMKRVAAPTALLFALSVSFFAFDMIMSLDYHWFSTIFGVYYFAGSAIACFSLLAIVAFVTQRTGRLEGMITVEHYHDLGKLTFAFNVFWAYIAFSQFMLIWYANIPEETNWYLRRITGEWRDMSWFQLWGHFAAPFVLLISRFPKRRPPLLAVAAVYMLFVHWIDLYWLVMPEFSHDPGGVIPWSIHDVLCLLGIGGIWGGVAMMRAKNLSLVPKGDPRLAESLAFDNYGG